jgi:protein SCO1
MPTSHAGSGRAGTVDQRWSAFAEVLRIALRRALLAVLVAAGGLAPVAPLRAAPVADFQLTDQSGRPFRWSSLRGTPVLVMFGFTHCPDVCPLGLQQVDALRRSGDPALAATRLVMISVDGDRDTPATLRRFLTGLAPGTTGLTGTPAAVRVVAEGFGAVFFKGLPEDKSGHYLVQHSNRVYIVAANGDVTAAVAPNRPAEITAAVRALKAPAVARR